MKKIIPLFVIGSILLTGILSCHKKYEVPKKIPSIINVSGLFSLTGNWSTLGITSKAAITLAALDINAYLSNKNADFRLSVNTYDTKLDPAIAVKDFATIVSTNTHFIIGPQSSAELGAIIPKADLNQVIVVSQGSTAGSLAIAGDPIFRFCPPDKVEGAAIANTIYKSGIRGLVTIARNDAGNLGLQLATGASFTALGGHISKLDAYATDITDYSTEVSQLREQVDLLAGTYGIDKVAIYLASFDECVELFKQAASDPVLNKLQWYGGDGVALSTVLTGDAAASDFAIATKFYAPTFGLPENLQAKWQPIADKIETATGIKPDAFALAAYDAMWVIAHTIEASSDPNTTFSQLETNFETQAHSYIGITGPTELDSFGDRDSGTFDYYGITKSGTNYIWTVVGESDH